MPKAKTKTSGKPSKKATKTKASKATKVTEPEPDAVDASDVSLQENTEAPPAPKEPTQSASASADSSGEDTPPEDPIERALTYIDSLVASLKLQHQSYVQQHRITLAALNEVHKTVKASRGRKRKKGGAKKSNTNSGIMRMSQISDQMRAFLKADDDAMYSYSSLCTAIWEYAKENNLQGMKTTDKEGNEKTDNRYFRLDANLKKLFGNFDTLQKEVAAGGKNTLMKEGKNRWASRAGVMKLIGPHLLKAEATTDGDAEVAEASSQ